MTSRPYKLGRITDGPDKGKPLTIADTDIDTHGVIFGVPGSGKSKFGHNFARQHRRHGRGICIIEPGDLIDDLMAEDAHEVMATGDRSILKKIHVVELSPFQLVRYDPFRFHYHKAIHPDFRKTVYRAWQHTKVQSVAEIYQWKQGQSTDFEGMPTLQRNFINMFTAVTTMVDDRRLTAADAEILMDIHHPDHHRVFDRLRPHLPREIVADFELLHEYRNPRDVRQDLGSFVNRIRTTHGPMVKEMIATDGTLPSIDLYGIIQRGDSLYVKTGKTPFASNDQNLVLASMIFHDLVETAYLTPRERRRPFTIFIDEAQKIVRDGIGDTMLTARKYKLGIVMATPSPVNLRSRDIDLAPQVLNAANLIVVFRTTWPEQLKELAEFVYAQNLDFTELMHEVERRAGQEWMEVDEWSETLNRSSGTAHADGVTVRKGTSDQQSNGFGNAANTGANFDPQGRLQGITRGNGRTNSHVTSHGNQTSTGSQSSDTVTEGESYGITISHKMVHLEKIVRELQRTGQLERSVADQIARFAQRISSQSRRNATVRVGNGKAVHIETFEVRDPFRSEEARSRAVEWMKRELFRTHDYYFTPTLDSEEQRRRVDAFVNGIPIPVGVDRERQETGDDDSPLL